MLLCCTLILRTCCRVTTEVGMDVWLLCCHILLFFKSRQLRDCIVPTLAKASRDTNFHTYIDILSRPIWLDSDDEVKWLKKFFPAEYYLVRYWYQCLWLFSPMLLPILHSLLYWVMTKYRVQKLLDWYAGYITSMSALLNCSVYTPCMRILIVDVWCGDNLRSIIYFVTGVWKCCDW